MEEEWKNIRNYEGLYQVSNLGRVKSLGRWINCKNKVKRWWQEEKILKLLNKRGYMYVCLWKNGFIKNYSVHRLVAKAFIQNPSNLPEVNHKDENKTNNCVDNLEWCTKEYNMNYGTLIERMRTSLTGRHLSEETKQKIGEAHRGKKHYMYGKHLSEETRKKLSEARTNGKLAKQVLQIDKNTSEVIAEFPSVSEVKRQLGISISNISQCCNGKRKTCCGFKWQYK